MRTINLIILLLVCISYNSIAQDIIHKSDGTTIEAKVKEVLDNSIKYKRLDNLDGPMYTLENSLIFKVVYESGYVEVYNKNLAPIKSDAEIAAEAKAKAEAEATAKLKAEAEAKAKAEAEAKIKLEKEREEAEIARLAKERAERKAKDQEVARLAEIENQKIRDQKEADRLKKLREGKRHTAYGEIMGLGGFLSINYQPRIFTTKNGVISISGRIGLGMSNKSIHIPHGFVLGIGSQRHQLEVGIMGVLIGRFSDRDAFNFLYGSGKESRYTVSPQLGYRLYTDNGFTFNVNLLMIYSEDAYHLGNSGQTEPGITPWFGIGMGYAF